MHPPCSITDSFADAEWDSLANTMSAIGSGVEGATPERRRLRTKMGVVRIIMNDKLRRFNGDKSIDMSFFIASFKTIQGMERDFDAQHIKKREFIIFLKLLFHKFGKQKLNVKKPRAMMAEFGKMKGVVEHGHTPL